MEAHCRSSCRCGRARARVAGWLQSYSPCDHAADPRVAPCEVPPVFELNFSAPTSWMFVGLFELERPNPLLVLPVGVRVARPHVPLYPLANRRLALCRWPRCRCPCTAIETLPVFPIPFGRDAVLSLPPTGNTNHQDPKSWVTFSKSNGLRRTQRLSDQADE